MSSSNQTSDVDIPIRRTDGDTLEDRMTGNAYDAILPTRYVKKDENGDPIETPEELFERVAKNIAVAEIAHHELPLSISPEHIKPDHPRRDELIEEVFGDVPGENDYFEAEITEENARYVSYDAVIDRLPDEMREDVVEWKETFHEAMSHLRFMPNSPTLMNAGDELQQLSACFVNSPDDDMGDIKQTEKEAALTFQSGGGMGYAFWRLRPYGDTVGSTGGIASGPVTFMRSYDQTCQTIAQGGTRRGAQMGIMRVSHPDVIQFIHAKNKDVSLCHSLRLNDPKDYRNTSFVEALDEARELIEDDKVPPHLRNAAEGHLANFNISVAVTDEFMECLKNDEEYTFKNPRTGEEHIATEHTEELYTRFGLGEHVEPGEPLSIPAEELWERMIEGAHENGEPGVVFIDRINDKHSFPTESTPDRETEDYEILATNPCGEQPLMEYEACNLGHINLSTVVDEDRPLWDEWSEGQSTDGPLLSEVVGDFLEHAIDWERLNHRIELGTRFLDNVVTMSDFPIPEIDETVQQNRKVGLGIMGLAQMFIQMGIEYGTPEANEVARQVMRHINHESKSVSNGLASERGSFGNWEDSKYADPTSYPEWFEDHVGQDADDWADGFPIRNHNTTTIAPTGTTSMIGNTSGGCEPIPNVAYYKNVGQDIQGEDMLVEFDDYFLDVLEANDISIDAVKKECKRLMANNEYEGVHNLSTVPEKVAELFVTTGDLDGIEHASVQCALQEGVDSAISKTVNAPNEATQEDTRQAFEYIYENGGKGITYYRDGSRSKQVITTRADNQDLDEEETKTSEEIASEVLEDEVGVELDEAIQALQTSTDGDSDETPIYTDPEPETAQNGVQPRERPNVTQGETHRISTGYGTMYVTINEDEHGLHEVFATIGKSGGFTESMVEGIARMVSTSLRAGVDVEEIIDQLEKIKSPKPGWDEGEQVQSIPDGMATALTRYLEADRNQPSVEVKSLEEQDTVKAETDGSGTGSLKEIVDNGENPECPECGSLLTMQEGCQTCEGCGWSKCG